MCRLSTHEAYPVQVMAERRVNDRLQGGGLSDLLSREARIMQ